MPSSKDEEKENPPDWSRPIPRWVEALSARQKRFAQHRANDIAIAPASIISTLIGAPADAIKTRMQAYPFKNTAACAKYVWKVEGFSGFWRGTVVPDYAVRSC